MVQKFPYSMSVSNLVKAEVCCLSTEKASQLWGGFEKWVYICIITKSKKIFVGPADEVC